MGVAARITTEINVPPSTIKRNIIASSKRKLEWLDSEQHNIFSGKVAIVGGAPSIKNKIDELKSFQKDGGMIFSLNGTHDWLVDNGINPDFFAMVDARPINDFANKPLPGCVYMLASQCHIKTFRKLKDHHVLLWHCGHEDFPEEEVKKQAIKKHGIDSSWTMVGARKTVGLTSIFLCYTLGFKDIYIYGMDSSFDEKQHAYKQKQNEKDLIVTARVGNQEFQTTPTLADQSKMYGYVRGQAEIEGGMTIHMRSEGLIKAMHEAKDSMNIEQREATKYMDMWDVDAYRVNSPGLYVLPTALGIMMPPKGSKIIDFGIGSGKAAYALRQAGFNVLGVDIAPNCLDADKLTPMCIAPLWDIPDSVHGDYGYCTDVMEHIPEHKVDDVLQNIKKSIDKSVFFQIDLDQDGFGVVIGDILHLTIKPLEWWNEKLSKHFNVSFIEASGRTLTALCEVKDES